jgi:hypothetical protein
MKRDDRQLMSGLAQLNTALPAFALRVMDNTATAVEHHAVARRFITLAKAISDRAGTLSALNTHTEESRDNSDSLAAARALSALVDMADALARTHGVARVRSSSSLNPFEGGVE